MKLERGGREDEDARAKYYKVGDVKVPLVEERCASARSRKRSDG